MNNSIPLAEVKRALPAARVVGEPPPALAFSQATHDSRALAPGALFVALRGERDGHDFIPDACERGASGVIAERLLEASLWHPLVAGRPFAYIFVEDSLAALQKLASYWRRRHQAEIIGVTGSVGKTSTKELTAAFLARRYRVLKSEGNYNNEIGLPITLLRLTPEHQKAVLEMAMYDVGEIALLCSLAQPKVGVVTAVGPTHLERLGTMERIAQAKGELVAALPSDGCAVLNGDDALVRALGARSKGEVITYGLGPECLLRAKEVESRGLAGLRFRLHWRGEARRVTTGLLGRHSVYTALAALAVGLWEGLSWDEMLPVLHQPPPGLRLALLSGKNRATIIDDTYNASPASTIAALDLLSEMPGRKVAVLGDMLELGGYEEEGHRLVGRRAAQLVNHLIVVGPRARWIGEEAQACGLTAVVFAAAKSEVALDPQPGDYILVKGSRGMRMEEIVAAIKEWCG